jgi:hypothetical protein
MNIIPLYNIYIDIGDNQFINNLYYQYNNYYYNDYIDIYFENTFIKKVYVKNINNTFNINYIILNNTILIYIYNKLFLFDKIIFNISAINIKNIDYDIVKYYKFKLNKLLNIIINKNLPQNIIDNIIQKTNIINNQFILLYHIQKLKKTFLI